MTQSPPSVDIEARVAAIVAATGQDEASVRTVLSAMDQQGGEPVGTVRYDPVSKAYAHRVTDRDVPKWRISHPADGMTYEMTPTKADWTLVQSPDSPAAPPEG